MLKERLVLRKLRALGITPPQDIHAAFQGLVLKLEEETIRHYAISQRKALRESDPSKWNEALRKYCSDIGIEVNKEYLVNGELTAEGRITVLNSILTLALEEEYTDLVEGKTHTIHGKLKIEIESPEVGTRNECFHEVVEKANELLIKLDIPLLPENATVEELRSAMLLLLSLYSDRKGDQSETTSSSDALYMNLDDVPCGIRSKDHRVIKAARILRMLHSNELCKLQAEIVWLSERFQQLTANPQTNSHAK
ncbi:hypothetical protein X943_002180 [Babesia divergens]|uniref:Uncharacterized protein n=1 Tax=Babesia divergens TaxID=32595 RepID=A0AAD9LI32_BABDI|nr:hypothetical protein X943_002180 [Babesia divergens]